MVKGVEGVRLAEEEMRGGGGRRGSHIGRKASFEIS
jgi:hypothetical protein